MRTRFLLPTALLLIGGCASGPALTPKPESGAVALDADRIEAHVRFLASDEMLGRRAGTPQDAAAARYIAEAFRSAGADPVAGAEDGYFQTVPIVDGVTSRNVLALVPGSDPALRDEVVVLSAHYDGLGATMDRRGATTADSIFNGARDNAVGVAALLEAARALAADPPARTVLLFATAAEEVGLVGSSYYVENPLVPLRRTVFVLNTDGAGYSDTTAIGAIGLARTTVRPHVEAGAADAGLGVIGDPAPEANLFYRSDNAPFARRGVPAATVGLGARSFADVGVADKYHLPADGPDDMDYAYLARFAEAYAAVARRIANAAERVAWTPGDEHEAAARDLYE